MQDEDMKELVRHIARQYLRVDTLEVRGRDHLDFHSVHVASLEQALLAAFQAGAKHAQRNKEDDEQGAAVRTLLDTLDRLHKQDDLRDWRIDKVPHNYNDGTTHFTNVIATGFDIAGHKMTIIIAQHLTPELAELMVQTHNNLGKLLQLARLGLDSRE